MTFATNAHDDVGPAISKNYSPADLATSSRSLSSRPITSADVRQQQPSTD